MQHSKTVDERAVMSHRRYAILVDTSKRIVIAVSFYQLRELLDLVLSQLSLRLYRTQYEEPSEEYLSALTRMIFC